MDVLRQSEGCQKSHWKKELSRFWRIAVDALFCAPVLSRNNSMCKYYGHVIEKNWSGHLPTCTDCGTKVTSPDQLRKASPVRT